MNVIVKVLMCAMVLGLAACGGGGGSSTDSPSGNTPPPSTTAPDPTPVDPDPPTTPEDSQDSQGPQDSQDPQVPLDPQEPSDPVDPPAAENPETPTPPDAGDPAGPYAPEGSPLEPTDAEAIEKVLGVALLLNQAAGSLYPIHDDIGTQVEAHGARDWENPDSWYTLALTAGGEVRIEWWEDIGAPGFSNSDYLVFTATDAGAHRVNGPVSVYGMAGIVREYFFLHTTGQWGVFVGDTEKYRLDGSLFVEANGADRYHLMHSVDYDAFDTWLTLKEVTPQGIVDYTVAFDLLTKREDPGVFEGYIEWERASDGLYQYMQTYSPVQIEEIDGRLQMVAGSFQYVHQAGTTQRVLRVSVAADPAFLKVEVDSDWDGEFDSEFTIPQTEIDFTLP